MTTQAPASRPLLGQGLDGAPAPRVALVTGSYGAGHNAAAAQLARVLAAAGCEVETHDVVTLLPWRLGRVLRALYYQQLRRRPESWGTTLSLVGPGRPLHRLVTRLLSLAAPPVADAVRQADLVVTTHPFGAQALGPARLGGLLDVPAVTYLTDASVHALWLHPGIDRNLALHDLAAQEARAQGADVTVIRPLVPPGVRASGGPTPDPLAEHRIVGRRALVTGGSLGMGDLVGTARDIAATGLMTPVVLCGTHTGLRRRLDREAGVVALGWRDDVPALLASSDCVVQNAGGFSCLEALAAGVPVLTYRPLPGHGVASCANLDRSGLVPWATTPEDLARLLAAAWGGERVSRLPATAPDVLSVLTAMDARAMPA